MRESKSLIRVLVPLAATLGVVIVLMAIQTTPSYAIPAFARKYQTSCTTCHNSFPELNDFGEAFKKNGFKFPKDDESFVKEPPVMLGARAQKEAFPNAVYPGEIPGTIPIGFRYSGFFNWNKKQPPALQAAGFVPQTDLFAPNTFTIISAGSMGSNLSFWIDDDISTGGSGAAGGLGDGYLKYNDLGRFFKLPKDSLNVRFGQFELDLPFSQARTIYASGYDVFNEAAVGGAQGITNNAFVLGTPQRGIEFGGYPNDGNFSWSVALVDGTNSAYGLGGTLTARNTKDVYVRISQRFNLERDAESRHAIRAAGPTGPRDHTSIRFGAFYYHGTNELNYGSATYSFLGTIQEPFYRAGGDIRFKYRNVELYGLGMVGHDDNHIVDTGAQTIAPAHAVTFTGGFAGANWWIFPWMVGTMRYDFVNSPTDFANGVSQYQTRNRFSPGFQILARANIKILGEYQYHWGEPYIDTTGTTQFFRPNTFVTGIDYVF
ncbi:MAG: hypothetical protein WCE50_02775 [Candidatus Acidiferrum sp.]